MTFTNCARKDESGLRRKSLLLHGERGIHKHGDDDIRRDDGEEVCGPEKEAESHGASRAPLTQTRGGSEEVTLFFSQDGLLLLLLATAGARKCSAGGRQTTAGRGTTGTLGEGRQRPTGTATTAAAVPESVEPVHQVLHTC